MCTIDLGAGCTEDVGWYISENIGGFGISTERTKEIPNISNVRYTF